jgi:hypothetical protein
MNDNDRDSNDKDNIILSSWSVESIDNVKNTITLLNMKHDELWIEDLNIDIDLFSVIYKLNQEDNEIIIELNDKTKEIITINNKEIKEISK